MNFDLYRQLVAENNISSIAFIFEPERQALFIANPGNNNQTLEISLAERDFLIGFFALPQLKISCDIKGVMHSLLAHQIQFNQSFFDSSIAAYLLDSTAGKYEFPVLQATYLPDLPTAESNCEKLDVMLKLQPILEQQLK
ncbi:MAG: hypothetical protein RRY34_03030, partial [Victivallaceae bacterium]